MKRSFFQYVSLNVLGALGLSGYILADTLFVAHRLGTDGLAALNLAISVFGLINGLGLMLGIGGATRYAICRTQGDGVRADRAFSRALACGGTLGGLLALAGLLWAVPLARLLGAEGAILPMCSVYLRTVLLFAPCFLLNHILTAFVRNDGNPKLAMAAMLLGSLSNIVLDYVFLKTLRMGVGGAAIATLISQALSVVLCVLYIKEKTSFLIPGKEDFCWDKEMLKAQLSLGISMGLMNSIVSIGSVILQSAVNKLGSVIIAGHTASRKVIEMFMQPLISIGVTATTYVSQNLGAGKLDRIRKGLHCCTAISFVWSTFCILISFWGIDLILVLVVDAKEIQVIATARQYFKINVFFFYALSVLFIYRNALQGLGKSQAPIFSSCIEMVVKILATLLLTPSLGYLGVCYTEPIAWILMAVFLLAAFYRDPRFRPGSHDESLDSSM